MIKKTILFLIVFTSLRAQINHKSLGISDNNAQQLFTAIQPLLQQTPRTEVESELNNFMGIFDLKELAYNDPILISSANGVGTKLLLAQQINKNDTIGIDLVAININELLTQGAEPLFFLDYYAMGKLEIDQSTKIITGMAAACNKSHCSLIGGQIAEIPEIYKNNNYDIAGFAVGVVEREQILPKLNLIKPGDIIIGIASSGLHTSGFSELKNIIESKNIDLEKPAPFATTASNLGIVLLAPTALYSKAILPLCKTNTIKAITHIAQGGLNNIAHIIPQGACAKLSLDQWYIPPIFRWIKHIAHCDNAEMFKVFNLGIGMALIADMDHKEKIINQLHDAGHRAYVIGKIHQVDGIPVQITGLIKNHLARIMILGNSSREHALAWKLAQSPFVELVGVVNGNAGTFSEKKVTNIHLNLNHINGIITYAQKNYIDLIIAGPDVPQGLITECIKNGLRCFGPTKQAAQLESSKTLMKEFIKQCNIPTAHSESFSNYQTACAYIQKQKLPLIIKTDGVDHTGVITCDTHDSAIEAAQEMLVKQTYGNAGKKIIVESHISDQEISFIIITDGHNYLPLTTTHNHPKRDSGDKGPHTMGMGSCCPSPIINDAMTQRITKEIIDPLIEGLYKKGKSFTGFLNAKIVIDKKNNPFLIEFSCNSGDPETPTILMRMQSDLYALCDAAIEKKLDQFSITWDERSTTSIALITHNDLYKGSIIKGMLTDFEKYNGYLFHGNTRFENNKITIDGKRILCAVSLGKTLELSRNNVYNMIKEINWPGIYYRKDIGYKAIARSRT